MDPDDLPMSLEMVQVQSKGPRGGSGEEADEGGQVVTKSRPAQPVRGLWEPAIAIWKQEIEGRQGNISTKQPTQPKVKAMMEKVYGGRNGCKNRDDEQY